MADEHLHHSRCTLEAGLCGLALLFGAAAVGCGVREYPHAAPAEADPSSDFGPPVVAGTAALPPTNLPTTPIGVAGGQPISVAGSYAAPIAGVGAPVVTAGVGSTLPPVAIAGGAALPIAGVGAVMPPVMNPVPATGVTIDLGGMMVPKEKVVAFIHIGHSNMAGRAIGPTATRPYFFMQPDPHAWMYHVGTPPAQAKEPDTAGDDLSGTYGGPGTALLKQAAAMAPSTYFMSLGFGKTSAYCTQFLPGALYYDTLIKAPKAIKDRVTFGAIVIMLGITERHGTADDVSGYSTCINQLVTAIRTDVGRPDLPLLITDYEQEATGELAISGAFSKSITPEIHKVPTVVTNSAIVPTDALPMQDDHHFNFDGHKIWTGRVLQIMKDKGWFPWQ